MVLLSSFPMRGGGCSCSGLQYLLRVVTTIIIETYAPVSHPCDMFSADSCDLMMTPSDDANNNATPRISSL